MASFTGIGPRAENYKYFEACLKAAGDGHLELLEYFHDEMRISMNEYICQEAAEGGQLDVLIFIRNCQWCNCCTWDADTVADVALHCAHMDILKWLNDSEEYEWGVLACSSAAGAGHLEVLQWLRERGCPWDGRTLSEATQNGHIELLEWARKNGCPVHIIDNDDSMEDTEDDSDDDSEAIEDEEYSDDSYNNMDHSEDEENSDYLE